MSLRTCINLLRELSHLESCTLDVALSTYDRPSWRSHELPILMPKLSFFFISWDWLVDVGVILDVLSTPSLRRLGLRGPPPTRQHVYKTKQTRNVHNLPNTQHSTAPLFIKKRILYPDSPQLEEDEDNRTRPFSQNDSNESRNSVRPSPHKYCLEIIHLMIGRSSL